MVQYGLGEVLQYYSSLRRASIALFPARDHFENILRPLYCLLFQIRYLHR